MSDWSLRLARPEDARHFPAIERSAAQAFADIEGLEPLVEGQTIPEERHRLLIAKGHCLTALVADTIAGFLSAERFGRALHIHEMSVDRRHQRGGIGAGLARVCGIDAANVGCECLTLTTFLDVEWNAPFYARLGFERIEDLEAWPRLGEALREERESVGATQERIAMVRFLP
jgi:predicted N-acetyltransferase YhbS